MGERERLRVAKGIMSVDRGPWAHAMGPWYDEWPVVVCRAMPCRVVLCRVITAMG